MRTAGVSVGSKAQSVPHTWNSPETRRGTTNSPVDDRLVVVDAGEHGREVEEGAKSVQASEGLDDAGKERRLEAVVVRHGHVPTLGEAGDNVDRNRRDDEGASVAGAAALERKGRFAVRAGRVDRSLHQAQEYQHTDAHALYSRSRNSLMSSMICGGLAGLSGVKTVVTAPVASPCGFVVLYKSWYVPRE